MSKRKRRLAVTAEETASVMAELAFFVGKGLQKGAGAKLVALKDDAREFWIEKHLKSIPIALQRAHDKGLTFADHRAVVTTEALKLGRIAVDLALAADPKADPIIVTIANVTEASKKVNEGEVCTAAKSLGAGGYCE